MEKTTLGANTWKKLKECPATFASAALEATTLSRSNLGPLWPRIVMRDRVLMPNWQN